MHNKIGESVVFNNLYESVEILNKCSQCDTSFSDNNNLLEHMKTHITERIYQCSQCDEAFTRNVDLKTHVRLHKGEKPYQCSQCDKTFSENRYLVKHKLVHTREKSHICSLCDKSFSTKYSLMFHMKTHTEERPYQCSVCDKAFPKKFTLLRHMNIHNGEKPYQCSQCDKAYSRNEDLQRHVKMHNGEDPYQCSQCDKTFPENKYLVEHMLTHSGEKPYTCSQCVKSFYKSSNLTIHMRSHSGEKPYQCSQCDKAFSRESILQRHVKSHTEKKSYQCSQCGKSYKENNSLVRHMLIHTGEKIYKCSRCEKSFLRNGDLKRHLKTHIIKHSGKHSSKNKATKCINPDCEETFYRNNDLMKHLRLDHNADLQVSQHNFISMNDFLTWKEVEETKNFIYYSKQCATKKGKFASFMYYLCQKGGSSTHHYRKGEVHRKSLRRNKKGVVKSDIFCPSRMKCKVDHLTGVITVTYTQSHNHQNQFQDTQHHPIPRSIVENVKLRLISGSSAKQIFKDLKKENLSANNEDSANNIQKKRISIRSIKVIAEQFKSKKNIEYQNHENFQEGSSKHETGISSLAVDVVKVNENTWNIVSYTSHKKEDANIHVIEFVLPYCGNNSCSDKSHELSCIELCSHMYHCSCREKNNLCNHIHKVHSSINQSSQAPNIITSEVVHSDVDDPNEDEPFTNIAVISEEYYKKNNSELDSEISLRTTTLKTIENIHNHLNDDKYRSLYLNRMSAVLERLNSEIEAIKSNEKPTQDKFDKILTEL